MAALDAGTLIRLGSGVLFVALGLAAAWLARSRIGVIVFGGHLIACGAYVVIGNLVDEPPARLPLTLAMGGLGLVAALLLPERPRRSETWILVAAGGLAIAPAIVFYSASPEALARLRGDAGSAALADHLLGTTSNTLIRATYLVAVFRLLAEPKLDPGRALVAAGIALPSGLWTITGMVDNVNWGLFSWGSFAITMGFVGSITLVWLVAASRGAGKPAVFGAWAFLATPLAVYALQAVSPSDAIGEDPFGMTGILRIVGWSVCVYAILRADLLGVPLPRVVADRGSVAAAVLAGFFVVAQVVENFVDARLGLLSGGIVAGALLFAASPIQRSMERLAERAVPVATPAAPRGAESYRTAVRFALKDRRLSHDEEVELARVADDLGLSASEATRIRLEVAREVRPTEGERS